MELEEVGFGGFDEEEEGDEDDEQGEEKEWKEGSESVVFGRAGEDEMDEMEEEVTPVMRVLEELGSSGGSTVGVGSVGRDGSDSATLAEPPTRHINTAPPPSLQSRSSSTSSQQQGIYTLTPQIHQRHSSRTSIVSSNSHSSSPRIKLKTIVGRKEKERNEETKKLKRRTQVVSGAVGALVLAMAGWKILGGNVVDGPGAGND